MQIDPEKQIIITLRAGQLQTVLDALGQGPFASVAPIISAIQQQVVGQVSPGQAAAPSDNPGEAVAMAKAQLMQAKKQVKQASRQPEKEPLKEQVKKAPNKKAKKAVKK